MAPLITNIITYDTVNISASTEVLRDDNNNNTVIGGAQSGLTVK